MKIEKYRVTGNKYYRISYIKIILPMNHHSKMYDDQATISCKKYL